MTGLSDSANGLWGSRTGLASSTSLSTPPGVLADVYSPSALFATNEIGTWYDPSDVANTNWRYNLLTYTEQFDNAAWTKTNSSITANVVAAPDGTSTADKLVEANGATANKQIYELLTTQLGLSYVLSGYVKASERYCIQLGFGSTLPWGGGSQKEANFNLTTQSIISSTGVTASISNVGNGWYHCVVISPPTTVSNQVIYSVFRLIDATGNAGYTGDGTSGIYLWGAQLNTGSTALPYQRITDPNVDAIAYFPSATLYQDSAGTTAVTAPAQSVGLMLDKSKQQTFVPRRNLLTYTEDFSNAAWTTSAAPNIATISANSSVAPDGTTTADTLTAATGGTSSQIRASLTGVANTSYSASVYLKAGTSSQSRVLIRDNTAGTNFIQALVNWSGGVPTLASTTGTCTVTSVGSGWYRFVGVASSGASANPNLLFSVFPDSAAGTGSTVVWGAQLEIGSTATDYQAVVTLPVSWQGNHATASGTTRPIYAIVPKTGRRNLLIYSEEFDTVGWSKVQTTISANSQIAPNGTATADTLLDTAATDIHYAAQNITALSPAGKTYTVSAYAKASTLNFMTLGISDISSGTLYAVAVFNLSTGAVATSGAAGTGYAITSSSISAVGSGWYRCVVTVTAGTSASFLRAVIAPNKTGIISAGAGGFEVYLGNGSGIFIWGAQLETGSTATAYQKVVTQYEVTEAGVPSLSYLSFDGVDDFMVTGTITPGTDKAQVFAGVRKLSDAGFQAIAETSTDPTLNNGAFSLACSVIGTQNYRFGSRGSTFVTAQSANTFAAPITSVLAGNSDISSDVVTLRINGAQAATSTSDQGTGNYLAYPLYIGRRGGSTLPFNGNLYGLITRFGPNLSSSLITQTEQWLNTKTQAF